MPEIYLQLCEFFHQDVLVVYSGLGEALQSFLDPLATSEKRELVAFLEKEMEKAPDRINATWDRCGSDMSFLKNDILKFYDLIIEKAATKT